MCGLAHYFEAEGMATVLVGFVREHIEITRPPRALWLDFPMGRPMGKPNDPEFQKLVIRSAFALLDATAGPVVEDFPEAIPVIEGRLGFALSPEQVFSAADTDNVDLLVAEVQAEMEQLRSDYEAAVSARGRTTAGASELSSETWAPFIAAFIKGDRPRSTRKGMASVPLLKLVIEDLNAYYTETWTHRDGVDDFELIGRKFWDETKAGQLILWLEQVASRSDDKVLRQLVELSMLTPRYWAEELP